MEILAKDNRGRGYDVCSWGMSDKRGKTDENVMEEKLCEIIFCLENKKKKTDSLRFIFVPLGID